MKKFKDNQKGFTLIELIVVIAILGILALMMVPKLSGFQEGAKEAADEQAAAVIANAAAMYIAKNPDKTTVDVADLKTAGLISDKDEQFKGKSKKYKDGTVTMTIADSVITTTLGAATGYTDFVIVK